MKSYAQSKLANVLHGKELAERLDGSGITVYSLHPGKCSVWCSQRSLKEAIVILGAINTDLQRHVTSGFMGFVMSLGKPFFKSPQQVG